MGSPALSTDRPARAGAPYLLDTHIWVWYLVGSPRLSDGVRREIDASLEQLWLSPISVWELGMLAARGRVVLDGGLRSWYAAARHALPLEEASLTGEVALRSLDIDRWPS
jgi:PIN domain nuclease of toxin-antitoxin system